MSLFRFSGFQVFRLVSNTHTHTHTHTKFSAQKMKRDSSSSRRQNVGGTGASSSSSYGVYSGYSRPGSAGTSGSGNTSPSRATQGLALRQGSKVGRMGAKKKVTYTEEASYDDNDDVNNERDHIDDNNNDDEEEDNVENDDEEARGNFSDDEDDYRGNNTPSSYGQSVDDYDDDDDPSGKYLKNSNRDTIKLFVLSVLAVLFCIGYLYERDLRFKLIHEFNESIDKASSQLYEARQKLSSATAGICPECKTCPDIEDIPLKEGEEEKPITDTDMTLASWATRDKAIVAELQNLARDVLILKYGPPPYYVRLNVEVTDQDVKNVPPGQLIFEMAPIEHVPYSVLYFLNQVSGHAWDGCSFFINLGVVYTEDARSHEQSMTCNKAKFRDMYSTMYGATSREFMAFQEYSSRAPHEELTLGISGRPAGTGIYISAQVRSVDSI
jgi:hypothetical protein